MIIARRLFQAARSRPRQIGLVEVFSTINLCLNLLNCNKFIQRILQDMLILKLLIWTSLFWPSSSRCRHLFAKGPFCQSQNARHKRFYSKASLLPYSWKKHVQFYWTDYMSFCVFLASFLEFSYSCFISFKFQPFSSFQFLSASLWKYTTALISN
jgi:hypothetical protein